jgi:hypothetical protein
VGVFTVFRVSTARRGASTARFPGLDAQCRGARENVKKSNHGLENEKTLHFALLRNKVSRSETKTSCFSATVVSWRSVTLLLSSYSIVLPATMSLYPHFGQDSYCHLFAIPRSNH